MISKIHSNENNKVMLRGNINIDSMNNKENIDIYTYIYTHTDTICIHTQYAYTHTLILRFDATFRRMVFRLLCQARHWAARDRDRVEDETGSCEMPRTNSLLNQWRFPPNRPFKSEYVSTCFPSTFYFDSNIYVNLRGRRQRISYGLNWIFQASRPGRWFRLSWVAIGRWAWNQAWKDGCSWVLVLCLWIFWV